MVSLNYLDKKMGFEEFFAISFFNFIGWFGLVLIAASFQFKSRITIGIVLTSATIAMTIHYVGREAWAAVSVAGTMIFGHLCGAFAERFKWLQNAKFVLLPVLWGFSLSVYSEWIDVIPAIAVTIEVACLTQGRTIIYRSGFLFSQPLWAIYHFAVLSGPGLASNLMIFSSSVIGLVRHHKSDLPKVR